jgi:hypothetical protein
MRGNFLFLSFLIFSVVGKAQIEKQLKLIMK